MPIFEDGWRMPPQRGIQDYEAGLGEALGATASEAVSEFPTKRLFDIGQLATAGASAPESYINELGIEQPTGVDNATKDMRELPMAEARAKVKEAGLEGKLNLGDGENVRQPVLDIQIKRALARQEREATIARGPKGFIPGALSVGTSFLVSAADPINLAAAFIPVIGEARGAEMLAAAGVSAGQRAAVRAEIGAASGAVGMLAGPIPIEAIAQTQEGRDYTFATALRDLMFGAALGGTLHVGGGAIADRLRVRKGDALYPFGPGEHADDGLTQTRPSAAAPTSAEAEPVAAPDRTTAPMPTPAAVSVEEPAPIVTALHDMPPQAKHDTMQAALADVIQGEPVRAGEMIEAAAKSDPQIAEAWNSANEPKPRRPFGARARPEETWSLFEFLASRGGLHPTDHTTETNLGGGLTGELSKILDKNPFVPGFGPLLRKGGMGLDRAWEEAAAAGYIFDNAERGLTQGVVETSSRDLLKLIEHEAGGKRQYRVGHEPDAKAATAKENLEAIEREFDGHMEDVGVTGVEPALRKRAVEIMHKEGISDADIAFERAVMENAERHERSSSARRETVEHIEGWDVPDDGRAAPRRGGEAEAGGPGGERGRESDSATAGAGARPGSNLDRATAEAREWRNLARAESVADPELVEASRIAAALPEPASLSPEPSKRVAAAQKAAEQAEAEYMASEPYLPEDLKKRVDAEIAALELNTADAAEVTNRGAACLAAAIG